MTSCIVGKKIGAVGSGHLELFPFVVLAICKCQNIEAMLSLMAMAGGISEHMLTSCSSFLCIYFAKYLVECQYKSRSDGSSLIWVCTVFRPPSKTYKTYNNL